MEITKKNDQGVEFIVIDFKNSFVVTLANLGASLFRVQYFGKEMLLYPKNVNDFKRNDLYFGKTIGRVANRIKNSVIWINKKPYFLASNENQNTLHGGMFGLHTCYFKSDVNCVDIDHVIVKYHYFSFDLESGFPGNLNIDVIYDITSDGNIKITYDAICDKDSVLNLTNHAYFCLGENSNENLVLTFKTDKYIDVDNKDLTPLKYDEIKEYLDFNNGLRIGEYIDDERLIKNETFGYDMHFCFTKNDNDLYHIDLQSDCFHLDIDTSFNGVQLFSDNLFDGINTNSNLKRRRAITLECQDSLLESHFLKANKQYNKFINLKFSYQDR